MTAKYELFELVLQGPVKGNPFRDVQLEALFTCGAWQKKVYGKPIVWDEVCYEGNIPEEFGNISGEEMTRRFWEAVTRGAYCTHGETYDRDDEVLWWAKGGRLHGTSPARIAFLRAIWRAGHAPGKRQENLVAVQVCLGGRFDLHLFLRYVYVGPCAVPVHPYGDYPGGCTADQ